MTNAKSGKIGIEKLKDTDLRGVIGNKRLEINAFGREIRELNRIESTKGQDIHLTIDRDLQEFCYKQFDGISGSITVTNIHTGAYLALASAPAFDPNKFYNGISNKDWNFLTKNKCHLILDESHRIKSQDAITALSIRELSVFPVRKDILSGTPITWKDVDLENQWYFLFPDIPVPQVNEFNEFFVRTTKRDLNLPPINRTESPAGRINVEMSKPQKILYSKILIPALNNFPFS